MKDIDNFTSWKQQVFRVNDQRWKVTTLTAKSADLPVKTMPVDHLCIAGTTPCIESMRDWVGHMKSVLAADLSFPIILDDEGCVMDGRHRIAKVLLEGGKDIKFVRFEKTPDPDFYKGGCTL